MSNRTLARFDDNPGEVLEDGELHKVGMWEEVAVERSAAGQPGLLFIITRYENSQQFDQMCVSVPDGNAFLAPVLHWLAGNRDTERHESYRRLREHFAAHLDVALVDMNESQARGAKALMEHVNLLYHGERQAP